jgi:hypothetical protein
MTKKSKTRKPKVVSMLSLKRYLLTKVEARLVRAKTRDDKRQLKLAETSLATKSEKINQELKQLNMIQDLTEGHIHSEHCQHHNKEENAPQHT